MKIITTAIIKGGAGKSTTAVALAQAAKADGKKVLFIDLDPQATATMFLGAEPGKGSYDLLHGASLEEVTQETEQGIKVLAAAPELATERTRAGSANRLQRALEPLKRKYNLVIIDTPPQMGDLTYNALQASTGLLIPLEADSGSLQGLYQIIEIAEQIQTTNPKLKLLGTVITRYDSRSNINRFYKETIEREGKAAGAPLLQTIRPGVAIKEAQAFRISLFEHAPKSNPAKDYLQLYEYLKK